MQVVSLQKRHIEELAAKGGLGYLAAYLDEEAKNRFAAMKYAFAAEVDGETVAAAGLLEYWSHRAEAWAFFDPQCRKHFLAVHNAVKRFLQIAPVRRIEAIVERDFSAGHRWIKSLGFELEAECLRSYTIECKDVSLYALIKE